MLEIYEKLPDGFLDVAASDLASLIPRPALIQLAGQDTHPLFVSILLHGNEEVGLRALQLVLRKYQQRELPRSLMIFIGNVQAASAGRRRLDGQPDFNRVWPGCEDKDETPEVQLMAKVVDYVAAHAPFASIDLHNNTGINPHYACINRLEQNFLHLARLFSRTVVYFLRPLGVQSMAMSRYCPSVTVECGRTGDESGIAHAAEFVDACLNLHRFPEHDIAARDIDLFHTVATLKVAPQHSIGFGDEAGDIVFPDNLDHLNFREIQAGTPFAKLRHGSDANLLVFDEHGNKVQREYFRVQQDYLYLACDVMPSMLTLNKEVIRQDCLGYLMERYPLPG